MPARFRVRLKPITVVACAAVLAALAGVAFAAPTAKTTRVSVGTAGAQGDDNSYSPGISADGRFVAYSSYASNLVPGDTNGVSDVFVRDRQTHKSTRVSVSSTGAQANGGSFTYPTTISNDGRYVAFISNATNLVTGDTNSTMDVFVRDRKLHKTKRVSVDSTGAQGTGSSLDPIISGDGGSVIFDSYATNLVPGDTNGSRDVFVRNLKTHKTKLVSVSSSGAQGDGFSSLPSISADGHLVGFQSNATNLVSGDANGAGDVFIRDLNTHQTRLVSVSSSGVRGNSSSSESSISADGRYIGFQSSANNLVAGDTNGVDDIFLRDLQAHKTKRVSVSSTGAQADGSNFFIDPSVSAHGEFVVFVSQATNLVGGDTNATGDAFIRDVANHKTRRLSVSSTGAQGNGNSRDPAITPDGKFVAFESFATNLVGGDTNAKSDIFVRGPLQP